jgi:hypothetical protein
MDTTPIPSLSVDPVVLAIMVDLVGQVGQVGQVVLAIMALAADPLIAAVN